MGYGPEVGHKGSFTGPKAILNRLCTVQFS